MINNIKIKNIILSFTSFLLASCANQLPPSGGEVDNIPPKIVEVYPEDGTINFSDDYFEIGFSEYVDKRSVQNAIFISPAIDGEIEYDWSGKYLRVYFPNELKDKTTYVITIGTDAADYNNKNRMAQAFTFTFSTGNEIDKRVITGKIYDADAEDVMIFAYRIDKLFNQDGFNDTISNPLSIKPDYISQAGINGDYKLMGLASGEYRIFAVQDEYRDLLFQAGQDRIGIPFKDIFLEQNDTLYSGMNFFLSSADTASPRLLSAIMTDKFHILVNLSEEFDLPDGKAGSIIINKNNFSFIDSATGKISQPVYTYKGNTKPTEFVLVVSDSFPDSHQLFVVADTLKDIEDNFYLNDFTSVTISNSPDTSKPKLFKTIPTSGTKDADYQNQEFYFFFDDAFKRDIAESGISFEDTLGRSVKFSLTFLDDASFKIIPSQKLEPQKDYIIEMDLSKFKDIAGNSYNDSLYQYKFKTISGLDFTGISGVVPDADLSQSPIIVLEEIDDEKHLYKQNLSTNNFNYERVNAGKYNLWLFYDTDSSGTYSYGSPDPFQFSEEFFFYSDTLNLKARWTQTDLKFELKARE